MHPDSDVLCQSFLQNTTYAELYRALATNVSIVSLSKSVNIFDVSFSVLIACIQPKLVEFIR